MIFQFIIYPYIYIAQNTGCIEQWNTNQQIAV